MRKPPGAATRLLTGLLFGLTAAAAAATPATLGAYNVKLDETSISGISSGAYMAAQFGVAWSSIVKGVGLVGTGPYACAQVPKPGSAYTNNLFTSYYYCGNRLNPPDVAPLIARANTFAADTRIDPVANMARQKVWMYTGYNDGVVKRTTSDVQYAFYANYIAADRIHYKTNQNAGHGMITDRANHAACTATTSPYLNNCGFDAAGQLLAHIHGRLQPRVATPTGTLIEFQQGEFASPGAGAISLSSTGRVYVPAACAAGQPCRVHVALHGCNMSHEKIATKYVLEAGYNEWADGNNLIVLYPQTTTRLWDYTGVYQDRNNTEGCWDIWGYNVDFDQNSGGNQNYATKKGAQIRAIKAMLDRLAGGYTGWQPTPPGSFGAPTGLQAQDATHQRIDLVWTPVANATGYHVYRGNCPTCTFTKLTAAPITGASYSNAGLSPASSYTYKVSAVGVSGESAASAAVTKSTAATPPACEPFLTNNYTHVDYEGFTGEYRALAACYNCFAYARGSGSYIGLYSTADSAQLRRTGVGQYAVGVCP